MLFNSPQFIFVFLPSVLAVFFLLARLVPPWTAAVWLVVASLVFYGWDDPWRLTSLILLSATFNYVCGLLINRTRSWLLLAIAVSINLALLAHYKYLNFITDNLHAVGFDVIAQNIILPIGISFYTFTQIAFLVDTYRGEAREYNPVHYMLFVTYFPHLVAGPIIHHKEMMPQFERASTYTFNSRNLLLGLCLFGVGLFKKVIFADHIATNADLVFGAAQKGIALSALQAWSGVLSYSLQLYFDFSGYSDMAIGLACMIGIVFPLNFYSPYKSSSIIEFWQCWHMTLSRFLRDYVYIPLGGNRRGGARRYLNLMITMLVGGLWHGASWSFVIWGALHGLALGINHVWRNIGLALPNVAGRFLTLLIVVIAWVPFRAANMMTAASVWKAMAGLDQGAAPLNTSSSDLMLLVALGAVALAAPNTAQIFLGAKARQTAPSLVHWEPSRSKVFLIAAITGTAIAGTFTHPSAFLYFRF